MEVKILTCVTNAGGVGPGHSAVIVGTTVYTFEDQGGWFSGRSGWLTLQLPSYKSDNSHRPVLIQTISSAFAPSVTKYVNNSIANDDDYGGSGVCSQQVAMAVNYALPADIDFDPRGFDTPFGVYQCGRRLGLTSAEEYFWPGKGSLSDFVRNRIIGILAEEYPDAHAVLA
jgi:hypothetical protein